LKVINAYWPSAGHPFLHGWIAQPAGDGVRFYVGVYGVDGPVTPHLQGLDGMFFVSKRHVVEKSPFDEATFDGFDGYDMDFSFAAHLAGFNVGTTAEIALIHASGGSFGAAWQRYAQRFDHKYRDRLSSTLPSPKWSFARMLVASRSDRARFPDRYTHFHDAAPARHIPAVRALTFARSLSQSPDCPRRQGVWGR